MYETEILPAADDGFSRAAELLRAGEVVGIPTETVYGLAANALDSKAVEKIFAAKGRPQDNPLIVHISDLSEIYEYVTEVPDIALKLAEAFWPGPMTMVLPKKDVIPITTSGGLDTVGIRLPSNPAAREIIRRTGYPLAAPSANLSGSPSPTSAKHVMDDMKGRIPAIIDGGECGVGVESTVISFSGEKVDLLRPGFVSYEDLCDIAGEDNVICAKGVTERISDGERVLSPGMKYKHYSPKANVTIITGSLESFTAYVGEHMTEGTAAMLFDRDAEYFPYPYVTYGDTSEEQARQLFRVLRDADRSGIKQLYARCPSQTGVGLAVYNRLLRAAGFEVIRLG